MANRPRRRKPGAGRPPASERADAGAIEVEIVGAAALLFARQGIAATTMAEIAESVGLGVSSLYYYFRNKSELLERIIDDVNRVRLTMATDIATLFDDAPRRLHCFVRNHAAALCEFPFEINEVHMLAGEDRETFATYWAERQQLLDNVEQIVEQGIEAGDFHGVDVSLSALTLLANDEAAQNSYRYPTAGATERSPDEIGVFVADLAVRALLVDPTQIDMISADTAAFVRPAVKIGHDRPLSADSEGRGLTMPWPDGGL